MKKLLIILIAGLLSLPAAFAQKSAAELSRERRETRKELKKDFNLKPSKDSKQKAKIDVKDGWNVPSGMRTFENQYEEMKYYANELMEDEYGTPVNRYILGSGNSTANTYNAAFAAARSNAQKEIVAAIETEIAMMESSSIDTEQFDSENAAGSDDFHQRMKSMANQCLKFTFPVTCKYKLLPNRKYVVDLTLVFDRNELMKLVKEDQRKRLKDEGDKLNEDVDSMLKKD